MFIGQTRVGISEDFVQITRSDNGFFKLTGGIKFSLTTLELIILYTQCIMTGLEIFC